MSDKLQSQAKNSSNSGITMAKNRTALPAPQSTIRNHKQPAVVADENTESFRRLKTYAKQLLKSRIFLGHFQEKRYVAKLNAYKDLIVLNRHEKILCDDITTVQNRVLCFSQKQQSENQSNVWMGFTTPDAIGAPAAYCIWTTLNNELDSDGEMTTAFGEYWFQIKTIRFSANGNEIEIQLKILRPVSTTSVATTKVLTSSTANSLQQSLTDFDPSSIPQYIHENLSNVNWQRLFNSWKTAINENTFRFFSEQVTWENSVYAIRMCGLLLVLSITTAVAVVQYLGEFTLKLIAELSKFMHVITPILIVLINMMGKMVGGLYILLAMMWRDAFGGSKKTDPEMRMLVRGNPLNGDQPKMGNDFTNRRYCYGPEFARNQLPPRMIRSAQVEPTYQSNYRRPNYTRYYVSSQSST